MATIELRNISKSFQAGIDAVKDVSFVAEEGEFIVLVGPSGCGKTTILRMIAGLEEITNGELLINDIVANNFEPMDRNIGMVFQEYALYPHLSVFDNLAFPLKVQSRFAKKIHSTKLNKEEIKKLVLDVAEHLELINLIHRKPKELSGGQRQRVALGRAIIRQPDLFLFDEPLSNLDARLRILMRQEIISLQRKYGITSIYVTHDQTEAMTMGSKIAVMKDGVLQQFDTPYNIYHRPINKFVADFIGMPSMNFFNG
jgi:multiple sugar transport system ATP-binding protein